MQIPIVIRNNQKAIHCLLQYPKKVRNSKVLVIIINGKEGYRAGPHRILYNLSVQIAELGYYSLNYSPENKNFNTGATGRNVWLNQAMSDICKITDYAQEKLKINEIVFLGMCDGGKVAFNAFRNSTISKNVILWSSRGNNLVANIEKGLLKSFEESLKFNLNILERLRLIFSFRMMVGCILSLKYLFMKKLYFVHLKINSFWVKKVNKGTQVKENALFIYGGLDGEARRNVSFYQLACDVWGINFQTKIIDGANEGFYLVNWENEVITITLDWLKENFTTELKESKINLPIDVQSFDWSQTWEPLSMKYSSNHVFGYRHAPIGAKKYNLSVILCSPFAEEQIYSNSVFESFAHFLACEGIEVIRFDYRGTGESFGKFEDITLSGLIKDLNTVINLRSKGTKVILVGLRFGCLISAMVANLNSEVNDIIMWQPTINSSNYIRELLLKNKLRNLNRSNTENEIQDNRIDIGGYLLSNELLQEIKESKFEEYLQRTNVNILMLILTDNKRYIQSVKKVIENPCVNSNIKFVKCLSTPFWYRTKNIYPESLIKSTYEWIMCENPEVKAS